MGGSWSLARSFFGDKHEQHMLMVGLDAAGKTTILYRLRLGKVVMTIPTIGFNMETIEKQGLRGAMSLTAWDVGGRSEIRALYRRYYKRMNALIFVVDSNDKERLEQAKDQLEQMLCEDELRDLPLLVFANKQDLPNAMPVVELTECLGLNRLRHRQWYIQSSCANTGDGLKEGMDWLYDALVRSRTATETVPQPAVAVPATWATESKSSKDHADHASSVDTDSTMDTEALDEDAVRIGAAQGI